MTSFHRICHLFAPIERIRRILLSSVAIKADRTCMMAMMMPTSTVINTIASLPVPNQMMMSGPSAILGRALRTTMYGSMTRRSVSLHQSTSATANPRTTAIAKPASVSQSVTPIW